MSLGNFLRIIGNKVEFLVYLFVRFIILLHKHAGVSANYRLCKRLPFSLSLSFCIYIYIYVRVHARVCNSIPENGSSLRDFY